MKLKSQPVILSLVLFSNILIASEFTLPDGFSLGGNYNLAEGGAIVAEGESARAAARIEGMLPVEPSVLTLRGRLGRNPSGINIVLREKEGEEQYLILRADSLNRGGRQLEDAVISLGSKNGWSKFFVRPNPAFYKKEALPQRTREWLQRPGASEHLFTLELRPLSENEYGVWLDGQLVHALPAAGGFTQCKIQLGSGVALQEVRTRPFEERDRLLLPVARYAREEAISDATIEITKPERLSGLLAQSLKDSAKGISVGGLGTFGNELEVGELQSLFWRRHANHQLPEQRMFTVPLETYSHAYILCALEDHPEKANAFTLRVTRYGGGRGDAMADTIVKVPRSPQEALPDTEQVGYVSYRNKKVPLWLVKVPIRNGLIQDLIYDDTRKDWTITTSRYLDVELLDPLLGVEESTVFPPPMEPIQRQWRAVEANPRVDFYLKRQPLLTSGVHIFGIELVKSPATMQVKSDLPTQVFYAAENPAFTATVRADKAGDYVVHWEIANLRGDIVDQGRKELTLKEGETARVPIPANRPVGWYAARVRLETASKEELIDYRTSFVMLPPDTRTAGLESPFYGWWFQKNQYSDIKLEEVGPLLQRLGIRRAGTPETMPESETLKYGFTNSTISFTLSLEGTTNPRELLRQLRAGKIKLEDAIAAYEQFIRKNLTLWPSIDRLLLFHESGPQGAPFPSEMWGEPAPNFGSFQDANSPEALLKQEEAKLSPQQLKAKEQWERHWPARMAFLEATAKMVREKFPQLKMQYGNDGNSLGIMGELFRKKFPKKWMDTMAVEDLGQTIAPERMLLGGVHSAWFLRETARKMGYGDVPVTACTEWIGRMTGMLGLQTQAEWKVRDGLISLAYGFDTISIAGINDAGSGYYFSIWANGGLTWRYPTMAPKPAYAAIATLTQVLDRAQYQRFVPTGSTVAYAQEFKRGDEWVYALWTPRGTRQMELVFPADGEYRLVELYGAEKTVSGKNVTVVADTAPQYLVAKNRVQSVTAGKAEFPQDTGKAPAEAPNVTVIPLEEMDAVSIIQDTRLATASRANPTMLPHKREGEFKIREVVDEQMGKCLEVELIPNGDLWPMEHEYVVLKLNLPIEANARNAGIWIKGNGSWGEVEINTKEAPPWASNRNGHFRNMGNGTLNFDGWNFIHFPYYNWLANQDVRVDRITITMPRKAIVGADMEPVPSLKIRIKSIVLF